MTAVRQAWAAELLHYARMIERFGRFPHRNALLGRESTRAEKLAVAAGNAW